MELSSTLVLERVPGVLVTPTSTLALHLTTVGKAPMNSLEGFDSARFILGKLCRRNHDWQGTGKTLRYIDSRDCRQCAIERSAKWKAKNPGRAAELSKEGQRRRYQRDPERHREYAMKWRRENPEKAAQVNRDHCKRRYWNDPERFRVLSMQYYKANRDDLLRKEALYRQQNPELAREKKRREYLKNRERYKQSASRWQKENPERLRIYAKRRRAVKRNALVIPYSHSELQQRFSAWDGCAYCGVRGDMTADHVVALARGGSDALSNLLPACRPCNSSKAASEIEQWYRRQPFFSEVRWQKIQEVLNDASH